MAATGRFQKGNKLGGRKAGAQNKVTKELKEMILGALDKSGGQEYLEKQATENPNAFMTLLGKILPTQVDMDAKVRSTISSEPMSADDWTKRYTDSLGTAAGSTKSIN